MTMYGRDISNHQGGIDINAQIAETDFLIFKATEGVGFVDSWCDGWVQACRAAGHPWGFYHFAQMNDPVTEADYFIDNTANYFGEGIPVLDWEVSQSVEWVNAFVERVHERTGVWPWIYANPWRFNQGGVNTNCGRWVAAYQESTPSADIPICAWQYTSTPLDQNYFYGDAAAWAAYVKGDNKGDEDMTEEDRQMLRAIYAEVTRTDDPTGRGMESTTHVHVKWIAKVLQDVYSLLQEVAKKLGVDVPEQQ